MILIDGKKVSEEIKQSMKEEIISKNLKPSLVVVQIGDNEASNIYVKQKEKMATYLGISFSCIKFDDRADEQKIKEKIIELNNDKNVSGIILQLPIPNKFDLNGIINLINPDKDVDGLTDINRIKLINNEECFAPCTPLGIIELLKYYNIGVSGKNVVIIGRSILVSKPLSNLLLNMDATITICHSKTACLKEHTKNADILISATGKKHLIKKDMIKKDSIVIDVGITRENGKLYGDVDFEKAKSKVSFITPVPGGVGPMTVTMLMKNTIKAFKLRKNES